MLAPARIHWSSDGWQTIHDDPTQDTGLGVHVFDLPAATLAPGTGMLRDKYGQVAAVNCALLAPRPGAALPDANARQPTIVLLIGINLGDGIVEFGSVVDGPEAAL